jgi:hypothetical protein
VTPPADRGADRAAAAVRSFVLPVEDRDDVLSRHAVRVYVAAASTPNPLFYERQRRWISTWGVPRFLQSFGETLDGGLILPRG